jgi:hypothetical protein
MRSASRSPRTRTRSRCTSTTSRRARGELEAAGVAFPVETIDSGVCHMAFFSDPDGNALMLHHRYAPPRT